MLRRYKCLTPVSLGLLQSISWFRCIRTYACISCLLEFHCFFCLIHYPLHFLVWHCIFRGLRKMIRCRLLVVIWCFWLTVGALAGRDGNVVRTRSRRQLLSGMSILLLVILPRIIILLHSPHHNLNIMAILITAHRRWRQSSRTARCGPSPSRLAIRLTRAGRQKSQDSLGSL